MPKQQRFLKAILFVLFVGAGSFCNAGRSVSIEYPSDDSAVAFAVQDLKDALKVTDCQLVDENGDLRITFSQFAAGMGPQSFRIQKVRATSNANKELNSTLTDMESMAHLGRYYADKIRGAADLAVYRADKSRVQHHEQAVAHLGNAVKDWKAYARIASSQYKTQLLSRSHYLDWWKILEDVKQEVNTVREERDN